MHSYQFVLTALIIKASYKHSGSNYFIYLFICRCCLLE